MSILSPIVFIVDDDSSVCRALLRIVRHAGLEAKSYESAEEFLECHGPVSEQPSCLVVDLHMPGLSGLDLQRRVSGTAIDCPLIFISGNGDIPNTVQAMRQGALTFLTKPFDSDDLLNAIEEALTKHRTTLATSAVERVIRLRMHELTEREREVMTWIITGALNKQIAAELDIVEKTVKVHRARVLEKMGAQSVAELVRLCGHIGFVAAAPSPSPLAAWA